MGRIRPGPAQTHNRQTTSQNRCKRSPANLGPAPAGSADPVHGWDPPRQSVGCCLLCIVRFSPTLGVCLPRLALFMCAFSLRLAVQNRKMAISLRYLGLDGLICDSKSTFPPCNTPLVMVSTPQNGRSAPLDSIFAPWTLILLGAHFTVLFGLFWAPCLPQKWVKNGSTKCIFHKSGPGPLGVPADVF